MKTKYILKISLIIQWKPYISWIYIEDIINNSMKTKYILNILKISLIIQWKLYISWIYIEDIIDNSMKTEYTFKKH